MARPPSPPSQSNRPTHFKTPRVGGFFRHLVGFGAALSLLAATAVAQPSPASRVFRFRLSGDPETLDWNRAQTFIESYILMNTMEGLVSFDAQLKLQPMLAESWSISEDRRTYTFKLKKGVLWSDGVPLRAQDFVYSWKRLLSPVTGAPYSYFLFDIEGAEYFAKGKLTDFEQVGIKAINDSTLEVRLNRPIAHWLSIPAFWVTFPLRQDVVESNGANWDRPGRAVVLGPYQLVSHEYGKMIVLRPNPRYHGVRGNIERVEALIVPQDEQAVALYQNQQLDYTGDLSITTLQKLQGHKDLKRFSLLKTVYLGFSSTKYPTSARGVRHAISMAIDPQELLQQDSSYEPARAFAPPTILPPNRITGADGKPATFKVTGDPAIARKLLKENGYDPINPWKLEILTQNVDKQILLANFVQAQLKQKLGLDVSIKTLEHKEFRGRLHTGDFNLFIGNWGADYPDPDSFFSIFLSSSGNNRPRWKNPRYDSRVIEARTLSDAAARERAYHEVQKLLLNEDAVIVPLIHDKLQTLVRPRVRGLELNPQNDFPLRKVNLD